MVHRLQRFASLPCHVRVVESRDFVALQLFPLQKAFGGQLLHEVKVPSFLGLLHARVQNALEVLLELVMVYRSKKIPPHVVCFGGSQLHLLFLLPFTYQSIETRFPAKNRNVLDIALIQISIQYASYRKQRRVL